MPLSADAARSYGGHALAPGTPHAVAADMHRLAQGPMAARLRQGFGQQPRRGAGGGASLQKKGQPNMDNCTDRNEHDGIVLLQMVLYIPVLALGIPLNAIAFWVFCCKIKRWTETKVYMINLIVADSFLIFTLPFLLYFTKYEHPVDGLCLAIQNIYFTNMPMSILIITLIAIDRYIAIKHSNSSPGLGIKDTSLPQVLTDKTKTTSASDKLVIRGHLTGHVQGALLVVPAQSSTAGLQELALSKDGKRTGTVHFDTPKMNGSSCNITVYEVFSLVQLCVYIPVLVLGIVLNVLALWVFCCKLGKWTETRVYMVNLAVADCLLLFTLPFKILSQSQRLKATGWCLVLEGGYFLNRFMSIGIITIIAADRYLAIKYPLRAKALRSPLKAAFASGFLWIVIICEISLIKSFEERREMEFCFEKSSVTPSVITLCTIITGFFIPLLILSYCSIQIIAELRRKKDGSCHNEKLTRKAVYIVSANMAVFIICFLPLYLGHLLRFIMDSLSSDCSAIQSINNLVHFTSILANTNCCLDAICYYFVNKEFKEASSKLAKSKSEANEETEI
ncbi:hypothetical protein TURU_084498 [Turdus rufiventris]|nr:hypothetical protein TURU_084498 [Turdus rufiventris]